MLLSYVIGLKSGTVVVRGSAVDEMLNGNYELVHTDVFYS